MAWQDIIENMRNSEIAARALKYLFEKNGLKIFKMSENKINGGSYRIYCKKNIKKSIRFKEQASYNEIIKFVKRVKNNKKWSYYEIFLCSHWFDQYADFCCNY